MPTYEFACRACNHRFSLLRSMAEHGRADTLCPQCGSREVEQTISVFTAKTSRKS